MVIKITKGLQSLSCPMRQFSVTLPMKELLLSSFSQFRRTIKDWNHSCISPPTGIAPTHAFIILFFLFFIVVCHSFWLNNLYTEIKTERAFYYVLPILNSTMLLNEALFYSCRAMYFFSNIYYMISKIPPPGAFIETIIRKSLCKGLRDVKVERKRQCDNHIIKFLMIE